MIRFVSRLFLAIVLVALAGIPAGAARAQDEDQDARDATQAAEQILQMAVDREFNAMYDLVHPDAYEVIPRAAAVGAFTAIYDEMKVGDASVTGVEIGPWTWGVTGKTYEDAAGVAFSQAYVDTDGHARILEDTMYLVKSGDEWRWFFGSDPDFVSQMIKEYGQKEDLPQGELFTNGDFLQNVVNDLSYTDANYVSPGVVLVSPGDSVSTGCGPASSGFWAFYCPPDQTLYLEEALLTSLEKDADFAAAFVIAHEWAHHIQTVVGFERTTAPNSWAEVYSIELELMADCFSGAWARDADTRGRLEPGDVDEAMQFTIERLGDPAYIDEYDQQAHGSADQRVSAFMGGYNEGFSGCNLKI
jgi:hypothetical protein